jgi:hypothetical protein
MKIVNVAGLISVLLIISACAPATAPPINSQTPMRSNSPTPSPQINVPSTRLRSYDMGLMAIPRQPVDQSAWLDAWDLLENNSDVVLYHVNFLADDWNGVSTSNTIEGLKFIGGMAKAKKLKLFIVLDPLTPNRMEIANVPSGTNFADPNTRKVFKDFAVMVVQTYRPTYLGLFSEVNTYLANHPDDAENVYSLISETSDAVKAISPDTIITSTFQYESLTGLADGKTKWDMLARFGFLDAVSITTYPSAWYPTPSEIPKDYYEQLALHTSKPIIIAESGWPSGGDASFHGSPENEKAFVDLLPQLTSQLPIKLWVWWFLHDWDGPGYGDYFKTMGLRTSDGTPKLAWNSWVTLHSEKKS